MNNHIAWMRVWIFLRNQEPRTRIVIEKYKLPHPRDSGARHSVGLPELHEGEFALADYRFPPDAKASGLHVREYRNHWVAHLDQVHPATNAFEHIRRDAPSALIGGGVSLGAALGAAIGKSWGSTLAGAGVGLLLASALLYKE